MGARRLTRWQKASALVPMALLVCAWGAALGNSGLATAADGIASSEVPEVPSTAFEQPASVQQTPDAAPSGIDPKAGSVGTVATLTTNGIPTAAIFAYRRAETLLGKADPGCHLPWTLVAAIGRVESNHGRTNGNALDADGVAQPGIFGVPLDGKDGRASITDSDSGALDQNAVYDLAIGPMQFIPGTWQSVGVDADNDGSKNPQSINDAATAAGIYLCAGEGDLSDPADAATAVKRYNHSDSYVELVLKIAAAYANGDFTQSPNGISTSPILTSRSNDQTLTPKQRKQAEKKQRVAEKKAARPTGKPTAGQPSAGQPSADQPTGGQPTDTSPTPGSGGGSTGSTPKPPTAGDKAQEEIENGPLAPLAPVTKPLNSLLSRIEADSKCRRVVVWTLPETYKEYEARLAADNTRFDACMAEYGF